MPSKKKPSRIRTVTAKVEERCEYVANTQCPYCKSYNESEVEEDGVEMTETCWNCKKKYKIKIPKDGLL